MINVDGVAFTGSAVNWPTDDARHPWLMQCGPFFAAGIPAFGSCNGMQLAASVLGGASQQPSPNRREDGLAKNIRIKQAGLRFRSVQYHPEYKLPFISDRASELRRLPEHVAQDIRIVAADEKAATRLAVRPEDMQAHTRLIEICNWLSSL